MPPGGYIYPRFHPAEDHLTGCVLLSFNKPAFGNLNYDRSYCQPSLLAEAIQF